jgi:dCMP deaminase
MGEIADWLMDQMDDVLGDYWGEFDDCWAPEFYPPKKKIPQCRYCGKTPLRWRRIKENWVLHEMDGHYHDCPDHTLPINVLKDILEQQKMKAKQLLPIPSWDETFMHEVYWWARRSKDPRTKIGAVLVLPGDKDPISHGYNGFARAVEDDVEPRWERPEKYEWVVHAEENSVLNCSWKGQSSKGSIMYTQGIPCTRCADAVVQGGIIEVVVHKQWQEYEKKFGWDKWIDSAKRTEKKFAEAGIKVRVFDGVLGMQGVLDGKVINI